MNNDPFENRHLAAVGQTGVGKTQLINQVLSQARELGKKAIIVDIKGEYYSRFGKESDHILSLYDISSSSWDLWQEKASFETVAASLIEENRTQPFWHKSARNLLLGHRHNLVEGLQFVREEGIIKRKNLQFFNARNGIRDTIVGIIANMLLNSEDVSSNLPLVGFAEKEDGKIKVSARGTEELVEKGLNLSAAMKKAAITVNGVGGGHNIAAGATIPKGKEEEFLDLLENEIKTQLSF